MINAPNDSNCLKILHTADLHFLGDTVRLHSVEDRFPIIKEVVNQLNVDALILAGDIFDTPHAPPEEVTRLIHDLTEIKIPCILLPGNHDGHIFDQITNEQTGDNIYLITKSEGETIFVPSLDLAVWGKPTYDHTPEFRPLQGMPKRSNQRWYIAVAHGLVYDSADFIGRSSLIYPEELIEAECDYIALGHVHAFRDVTKGKTPAFYSGAPWGFTTTPTVALISLCPEMPVQVKQITVPIK
jgi:DNA repair exonuclease SbcCD nuclease subunit